ncbi:MAG TPA: carotenoid oxygenase family protein [Leptospiraceae bacterium]|nr:carotenoid oxygenase family protein [Leptospiraceae bacterium]HMW07542.1 carotenoid oxygenase family protein [Leptospiraceae bacterium]HMX34029.1 carotenoid oxygenase family protein [Leptospiraceae bacterium]HMY33157.1 carotenoid oxygenase family protein [Leptospiraceae bacterium]HMZ67292.1 carotenoid oxygenase family protein [Leptospiraceae bacterium]
MKWQNLFNGTKKEFEATKLKLVSGELPKEIKGDFYINTSVMTTRGGKQNGSWFDGDGAVLRVHLENGEAEGTYKYTRTKVFVEEEKADKFLYPTVSNLAPGFFNRLKKSWKPANRANTSVYPLSDKLMALFDGDTPYELDLKTLETKGESNFNGAIGENEGSGAHIRIDPNTGELFSFGFDNKDYNNIILYKFGKDQKFLYKNKIKTASPPLMTHDIVFAGDYILFWVFPLKIDILPMFLKLKPPIDSYYWNQKGNSHIYVVRKKDLSLVAEIKSDANYFLHFINGFQSENGALIVDLIEFNNFDVFTKWSKDAVTGNLPDYEVFSTLVRYELDINEFKVVNKSVLHKDSSYEWPLVKLNLQGKPYDHFFICHGKEDMLTNQFMKMEISSGKVTNRKFGPNSYCNEPSFIPSKKNTNFGYLILVVYNGELDKSFVHILDEEKLEDVCVFELPSPIGNCSHGKWKSLV